MKFGEKIFGGDIQIENCSLRLNRSIEKSIFWKFFFFQHLQKFERTFTVLGEKVLGRDIKIEKCTFRLIWLIKKSNFWKFSLFFKTLIKKSNIWLFSFFLNSSELWTNIYRAWRKSFGQGYQNWKLYFMSSEYHVADEKIFLKFCKFSFHSDLEHNFFGFVAAEFSLGLSKLHSTCLFEFSLRCWH